MGGQSSDALHAGIHSHGLLDWYDCPQRGVDGAAPAGHMRTGRQPRRLRLLGRLGPHL